MSEAKLTKKVKTRCESVPGLFYWKVSDRYTSGIPDLYIIYRGISVHIELKDKGKKPEPLQLHMMKKINQAGGLAFWFDDYDKFNEWFSQWLEECRG